MPSYPLREELFVEPLNLKSGRLLKPTAAGLGVRLTKEIENQYPFRSDAIYDCAAEDGDSETDSQWGP